MLHLFVLLSVVGSFVCRKFTIFLRNHKKIQPTVHWWLDLFDQRFDKVFADSFPTERQPCLRSLGLASAAACV